MLSMLEAIGSAWLQQSPEGMLAKMSGLPDNQAIDFVSRYVVADADASQRERMVDYLAENTDKPEAHQWAEDILSRQAKEDPEAALSWTNRLNLTGVFDAKGAGNSARGVYNSIAQEWTTQDSQAASLWISGLESGARRNSAVTGMISTLIQGDAPNWDAAFAWSQSLDGERDRTNWLRNTLNAWHRKDPQAAEQALNSAALPKSVKETLRAAVSP